MVTHRGPKGDTGEQGNQGNRGERGQRGMPPGQRRAIVFLFVFSVVLSVTAYLAAVRYYHDAQAAQRRESQVFEQKICTTLGNLAAEQPPPGRPGNNPSRAYLQGQHVILAQLGPDVGCQPKGK